MQQQQEVAQAVVVGLEAEEDEGPGEDEEGGAALVQLQVSAVADVQLVVDKVAVLVLAVLSLVPWEADELGE